MSFEAVWGFDPEKVLRVQKQFQQALVQRCPEGEQEPELDNDEGTGIPSSAASQVYELCRMFPR